MNHTIELIKKLPCVRERSLIKKFVLIALFFMALILSACTQGQEDTQEYSGIISERKVIGYEYTVIKEENSYSWKIGYKGDITTIEESIDNEDELGNFMMAVNDSKLKLSKLVTWLTYFLIVAVISFYLYKKDRKTLKDGAIVIVLAIIISLYISIDASIDLSTLLKDVKLYYLRLTI
ncbi:hypothetical protein [Solibacillus sp. FSL K6-1523]|uniref:hypothetical protein n=1 Tax=Solibacillus sp. FSL K6-1523 TaxID=2921471 RepID=UPI0030FBC30B